jgi:dATP pyrophosphohydrolase
MPPTLRTDILEAHIARRSSLGLEFLQLLRATPPLAGTWQPVLGHIRDRETAVAAMWRELREEVGLSRVGGEGGADAGAREALEASAGSTAPIGAWSLEQTMPYYISKLDAIVLSPRFVVEVPVGWAPTLNHEHKAHRWVVESLVPEMFVWPSQHAAIREAASLLRGAPGEEHLRV